ncbi:MAG: DUF4442 domain-containing protein [Deltaproteobacteria bacterium]|nr:DUF4442 domain-containing protein [Deltaproteobacteria bacterium]
MFQLRNVALKRPRSLFWPNLKLRLFAFFKVPVLFFVKPTIAELSLDRAVIQIGLTRKTRNHYRSMYFGVLAAGADVAAGILAMEHISASKTKIGILFKSFRAEFLKRAESDVFFICEDGKVISKMVAATISTGERQNAEVKVRGVVKNLSGPETVAEFVLTLSLKKASQ